MQLNQTTDYAIRTALFLAKEQRIASSQEISIAMNIPQAYLLKITKLLAQAGILQSYRGIYGGISLKNKEATLLDIIRVTESHTKINRCLEVDGYCSCTAGQSCSVCRLYTEVQGYIEGKLGGTTLRELAGSKSN